MLGFLGQYRFITPLCEGLVSSGLDSIKKLATIHAKKEKKKKKPYVSKNTCFTVFYVWFQVIACTAWYPTRCPNKQLWWLVAMIPIETEEIALTGTKLKWEKNSGKLTAVRKHIKTHVLWNVCVWGGGSTKAKIAVRMWGLVCALVVGNTAHHSSRFKAKRMLSSSAL